MNGPATCCPCDGVVHPSKPIIAAGLPSLTRQLAGFPEYRQAMLRAIATHPPLQDWRAREGEDYGVMLLEMWAYVLDILGFYDERIANESYLRTAVRRSSLRRVVDLIGYKPRPGLAATAPACRNRRRASAHTLAPRNRVSLGCVWRGEPAGL